MTRTWQVQTVYQQCRLSVAGLRRRPIAARDGRGYWDRLLLEMLVLALDTTTRAGSVALARDGVLVDAFTGDGARPHATRLPGDILSLLARQAVGLPDIDLYAVAAGPGSFTGLRIGIAAIQGLAFANQKSVVAVSALEALAQSAQQAGLKPCSTGPSSTVKGDATVEQGLSPALIGAWMDAQRGEVYVQLFDASSLAVVASAQVEEPGAALDAWSDHLAADQGERLLLIGDGALAYRALVEARLPRATIAPIVPLLAPAIARLAARAAEQGLAGPPHAIRPLYVRRPDAELARDRARQANVAPPRHPGEAHG